MSYGPNPLPLLSILILYTLVYPFKITDMSPTYPDFLYEREFIGYGYTHPKFNWPGGANIAVSFVINFTMGSEMNLLNGDAGSEIQQLELPPRGNPAPNGKRFDAAETMFEYGGREGVPRLLRLFAKHNLHATWPIATQALEYSPYWCKKIIDGGHEIAAGSKRAIDYLYVEPEEEEKHIASAIDSIQKITGDNTLPHGWLIPRYSNISPLLYAREHEIRGLPLLYSSDSESDELPYWVPSPLVRDGKPDTGMLVVPVTHDTGDFRFTAKGSGWASPSDFYEHLVDTFDVLYAEGAQGAPKMMTVILHPHIIGHGGRCFYLEKFLQYLTSKDKVWVAKREEIAAHWAKTFPYDAKNAFGQTKVKPFRE